MPLPTSHAIRPPDLVSVLSNGSEPGPQSRFFSLPAIKVFRSMEDGKANPRRSPSAVNRNRLLSHITAIFPVTLSRTRRQADYDSHGCAEFMVRSSDGLGQSFGAPTLPTIRHGRDCNTTFCSNADTISSVVFQDELDDWCNKRDGSILLELGSIYAGLDDNCASCSYNHSGGATKTPQSLRAASIQTSVVGVPSSTAWTLKPSRVDVFRGLVDALGRWLQRAVKVALKYPTGALLVEVEPAFYEENDAVQCSVLHLVTVPRCKIGVGTMLSVSSYGFDLGHHTVSRFIQTWGNKVFFECEDASGERVVFSAAPRDIEDGHATMTYLLVQMRVLVTKQHRLGDIGGYCIAARQNGDEADVTLCGFAKVRDDFRSVVEVQKT
ncbi:hypothetical protein C8R43DRAFT_950556 [Mycena crocata]|nr:hypothetical protein C8R43DRAFT_950556 [Mycena crocata]